ncbi:MAG TPA: HIT family protein [Candidatus Kapabacteria bacterium]|nr:HIT family protein [Candidatus Kapabacteria bacterium]
MPEIVNGMPCLFCQIVDGENPHHVIYEDEDFLGFLDKYPLNPGHTQLIPKRHTRWVWDMDNADIGRFFIKAKRVSRALQKVFETEWVIADTGGIGVPHSHIHLVPRYEDDGHGELVDPKISREITEDEMASIAEKIRLQLSKN